MPTETLEQATSEAVETKPAVILGQEPASCAERLHELTRAVGVRFSGIGRKRVVPKEQRLKAARQYNASIESFDMSRILLNSKHPAVKAVNQAKTEIRNLWEKCGLPYVEAGLRLIPEREIRDFRRQFETLSAQFARRVEELSSRWHEVIDERREALGELFRVEDYPEPKDSYSVSLEFLNVEPPSYLKRLDPKLYEEEHQRMMDQFREAADSARDMFLKHFADVTDQLAQSLAGFRDGKQKSFKTSVVQNLFNVLEEYEKKLQPYGIGNSSLIQEQLGRLRKVIAGTDVHGLSQELRESRAVQSEVITAVQSINESLVSMMTERPRRAPVMRRGAAAGAHG